MPFGVKRDVIEGLGVRELVVIPFDDEFAKRSAEEFIEDVLIERLGAERVSVGENFRFGAKAKGDPAMLAARSEFETRVVPLVEVDGETVSSTRIRALVAAGDMEGARHCLGAPFMVEGEVVERRPARPRARLPDRQPRPRRPPRDPRPRRLRGLCQRRSGRRQRRRAADLRERPRRADRDLPDRLRGRPLRHRRCGSPSSSACAARSASPSVEELIAQMRLDVEDAKRVCASFQRPYLRQERGTFYEMSLTKEKKTS